MATADNSLAKTEETPRGGVSAGAVAPGLPSSAPVRIASERGLKTLKWAVAVTSTALLLFAAVRICFVDGILRPVTIDGPSMALALCGPHYWVVCGDCGFLFRCDAEHLPADRRVVCPNCGFADNSLDPSRLRSADRVVIDRWPLLWRSPARGDVVAVKRPAGEFAVKRIAALPGEHLAIRNGDLFDGDRLLHKLRQERLAMRQHVHDNHHTPQKSLDLPPRWRPTVANSHWKAEGAGFRFDAAGADGIEWLEYQHWACTANMKLRGVASPVTDNDAYNQGELRRLLNPVADVTLSCRLRITGKGRLMFAARDGDQQFEVEIEPAKRVVVRTAGQTLLERPLTMNLSRHEIEIEFGLCDQQVILALEGRAIVRFPYERPAAPRTDVLHPLAIGATGLQVRIRDLCVWRDINYLDPQGLPRNWQAPAKLAKHEFAVLGDNQPVSIDSRQWEPFAVSQWALIGHVYRPFWIRN